MMLDNEFEVRMKLSQSEVGSNYAEDGSSPSDKDAELGEPVRVCRLERNGGSIENPNYYVTDLDVATIARANALLGATDEERGPWAPDGLSGEEIERLMFCDKIPIGDVSSEM